MRKWNVFYSLQRQLFGPATLVYFDSVESKTSTMQDSKVNTSGKDLKTATRISIRLKVAFIGNKTVAVFISKMAKIAPLFLLASVVTNLKLKVAFKDNQFDDLMQCFSNNDFWV